MSDQTRRFLKPNPALLEGLEGGRHQGKTAKPRLAHELGQGSRCSRCGDECPGFQLHYWRKVCQNCRCGKAEHNVQDAEDPGFYFIGKLFDRPLRTRQEEMEFCYGDFSSSDSDDGSDDSGGSLGSSGRGGGGAGASRRKGGLLKKNGGKGGGERQKKTVRFEWVPPNISINLARRYLEQLPRKSVPISGSGGARFRLQQLERQFPVHDVEPAECHELTDAEVQSMQDYVDRVRQHVVGQGVVTEVNLSVSPRPDSVDLFPPPPDASYLQQLSDQFGDLTYQDGGGRTPLQQHPSAMLGAADRKAVGSAAGGVVVTTSGGVGVDGVDGVFTATPYNAGVITGSSGSSSNGAGGSHPHHGTNGSSKNGNGLVGSDVGGASGNGFLRVPRPFGSTASSLDSSRNDSPSPTSSSSDTGTDPRHTERISQFTLHRPSQITSGQPGSREAVVVRRGAEKPDGDNYYSVPRTLVDGGVDAIDGPRSSSSTVARVAVAKCQECKEDLFPGDVAVQADRAGKDKMWHPRCFKCHACREILVDLLYYYDNGRVFCARDYAENANIPRCQACDELIFAPEYTGAEDKTWHIKHFCCYLCDKPLAGHKYIPVKSQPHCLDCYNAKHGKTCSTCLQTIDPQDQRVSLQDQHWHARPECFKCAVCGTSLLGRKMTKKDGLVLCSSACTRRLKDLPPSFPAPPPPKKISMTTAAPAKKSSHRPLPPPPPPLASAINNNYKWDTSSSSSQSTLV